VNTWLPSDAAKAMSWLASNDVDCEVGKVVYTQLLNERGGIEADVTVCRLQENCFYIVTGTGFATRDFNWIEKNIPHGFQCSLTDVTSAYSVLSLMGPASRSVLAALPGVDARELEDKQFPFASFRTLFLSGAPVRALRVSYLGGLGWELHVPVEFTRAVYSAIMSAGSGFGLINAGYRCIESCRLEMFF